MNDFIDRYLTRIKYAGNLAVDVHTLQQLHECHVLSIPFESLDIFWKRPIQLTIQTLFRKVVENRRGGFCYELNYLFYRLLIDLGFNAAMVSSRIIDRGGQLGPEFDHMSIVVKLEQLWLVDVGYGDLFLKPIEIKDGNIVRDKFRYYQICHLENEKYSLNESKSGSDFQLRYEFTVKQRTIEDFYDQCYHKQYSKESFFVQNRVCTMPSASGRVTIINDRLIKRWGDMKEESKISTEIQFDQIIEQEFGIKLIE